MSSQPIDLLAFTADDRFGVRVALPPSAAREIRRQRVHQHGDRLGHELILDASNGDERASYPRGAAPAASFVRDRRALSP